MTVKANRYVPTKDFVVEKMFLKKADAHMHYHSAYEIYYVIDGERDYFIGDSFYKVLNNEFILVPKNILHRTAGKGATRVLIFFTDKYLQKYFSQKSIDYILSNFKAALIHPEQKNYDILCDILHFLIDAVKKDDPIENPAIACKLFELLIILSGMKPIETPLIKNDYKISQIIQYINQNYATITYVDEIAEHFYLSKYYLCHVFTKAIGSSLTSYINMVRIRQACNLMDTSELSITDIALKCGFNSSAYFSKVFKDETGLSPRRYRSR